MKKLANKAGINSRALYQSLSAMSIRAASREQKLLELIERLRLSVPDLRDQYTFILDEVEYNRYWEQKLRSLHAWQIQNVNRAIKHLKTPKTGSGFIIADIGDSSGNHATYLKTLNEPGFIERVISINIDQAAINKIRDKGGEAICCRAEDIASLELQVDLFISLEMVEHLTDPVRFLRSLAKSPGCDHLLMTVPYRRHSRFGGSHLRKSIDKMPQRMTAEEVHIFELCPKDWVYLARFSGYRLIFSDIYYQYPRRGLMRIFAAIWRYLDFEGFLVLYLESDLTVEKKYTGW